jgi:hypothetical protein
MARSLALVALLLLSVAASASAASDAPFVVAHKKVSLSRPKPGVEHVASPSTSTTRDPREYLGFLPRPAPPIWFVSCAVV